MKKLLSILLCMMLIASLIPISASATETTESTDGASLEELEKFSGEELADQRYAKFRAIGRYVEVAEENGAES